MKPVTFNPVIFLGLVLIVYGCGGSGGGGNGGGGGGGGTPPGPSSSTSCKDILNTGGSVGDGVYSIDPDGAGGNAPIDVYCDMTTDGGGWTALINPSGAPGTSAHPDLTVTGSFLAGTGDTCINNPFASEQNSWWAYTWVRCGDWTIALTLDWPNPIAATDLMFIAVAMGQTTHTITANGANLSFDASSNAGVCYYWNGTSTAGNPATGTCWSTYLVEPPHVYNGTFTGDLSLVISAGPACQPDCNWGVGMNIQKLFVR